MVRRKRIKTGLLLALALFAIDIFVQIFFVGLVDEKTPALVGAIVALAMAGITLPLVALILEKMANFSNSFCFWKVTKHDFKAVGLYLLTIYGGSALILIVERLTSGSVGTAANQQTLISFAHPNTVFGLIVLTLVVAPLIEELIFRGIMMSYLLKDVPAWAKISASGILFGLFHMTGGLDIFPFIQYMFIGLVLAFAFWRKGKIQISMMVHFANNFVAVSILLLSMIH